MKMGYGIIALAVIAFFIGVMTRLIYYLFVKKVAFGLRFSNKYFDKNKIRELLNYSLYSFVSSLGDLFRFKLDSLVISIFLNLTLVTHYNIAVRLITYFMNFIGYILGVIKPVFSQYEGANDFANVREKFLFFTKISSVLTLYLGISIILFSRNFIERWVGIAYLDAYYPLVILCIGSMVELCQKPSISLMYGISKHKFYMYLNLAEGMCNLLLSLLLVKKYGIIGIALGTTIPTLVTKISIQPIYVCRIIQLEISKYLRELFIVIFKSLVVLGPLAIVFRGFLASSYLNIFIIFAIYSLIFTIYSVIFIFNQTERKYLFGNIALLNRS